MNLKGSWEDIEEGCIKKRKINVEKYNFKNNNNKKGNHF